MVGYYRKFIRNFTNIAYPLTRITTKEFENKKIVWLPEHEKAFQALKDAVTNPPVLSYFRDDRETYLFCDASRVGIAGCLSQKDEQNNMHPIAFVSRRLTKNEEN